MTRIVKNETTLLPLQYKSTNYKWNLDFYLYYIVSSREILKINYTNLQVEPMLVKPGNKMKYEILKNEHAGYGKRLEISPYYGLKSQ